MVPADDEQHPETTQQQLSSDNTTSTHSNDAPHLTPMPRWLMHWWTPLAIAEGLLRWTLIVALFWGGQPHWPSSEAMKLCMTITGAGLAFSAWQQRSHDNIAREKDALAKQEAEKTAQETAERNRREQIERDEYWKRREQAYHLLTSPNPSTRLGAVALLQELAEIAPGLQEDSNSERHNFQQHIITTLCSQVRHEGLLIEAKGNIDEHAAIQNEILTYLFTPLKHSNNKQDTNTTNVIDVNLSHTNFYTPLTLHSLHITQRLDVRNSIFHSRVTITDSTLNSLHWAHAAFRSQLNISDCTVIHDRFPDCLKEATFSHVIFKLAELTETEHQLQLSEHKKTRTETNIITFDNECHLHGSLKLITREGYGDYSSEIITIDNSTLDAIEITSEQGHTNNFHAILTISGCKILESLHIHNINYWFPAAEAHTESELAQMSVQDIEDLQNEIFYTMHSPLFGNDPAYTDATYTQQSAIYLISNSFSDTTLEHHPQFEEVNGYEDGEGYQSKKFITFSDNATLDKKPLMLSQWLNKEGVSEEHGDNRCIELSSRGNIEDRNMS